MSSTDDGSDVGPVTEKRPIEEVGDGPDPDNKKLNTGEGSKPCDAEAKAVDPSTLTHLTNPTRHNYLINEANRILTEYQETKEKVMVP